jgi:hypothetical protein
MGKNKRGIEGFSEAINRCPLDEPEADLRAEEPRPEPGVLFSSKSRQFSELAA